MASINYSNASCVPIFNSSNSTDSKYDSTNNFLWIYVAPAIIILGTTGNILTILTMQRKPLISTVTSPCLICLAVVDTLLLNTGLLRHCILYVTGKDFRNDSDFGCRTHRFVVYWSTSMAAWLLMLLSVERFISICLSSRFKVLCTRRNTRLAMLALGIGAAIFHSHFFWTTELVTEKIDGDNCTIAIVHQCLFYAEYQHFAEDIWPWLDFVCSSILPFLLLFTCNLGIINVLISTHRVRGRLYASSTTNRTRRSSVKLTYMTIILMTCSVAFLILTAPLAIYIIIQKAWTGVGSGHDGALIDLFWTIVNLLFYTNSSINFFLYTISAARFRREFWAFTTCTPSTQSTANTKTSLRQTSMIKFSLKRRSSAKTPRKEADGTNNVAPPPVQGQDTHQGLLNGRLHGLHPKCDECML